MLQNIFTDRKSPISGAEVCNFLLNTVVVRKCFIKHMCFIVLYFQGHAFFSLEIPKKCFFVLYFLKNVLYFCKLFKFMELPSGCAVPGS